jgi:hypothetical protein
MARFAHSAENCCEGDFMESILRIREFSKAHSLRAAVQQLATKLAPYETRAFLLWTATAAGFTGTAAVRRCPAAAHLGGWVYLAVIGLTLLLLLLDEHAWEKDNDREDDGAEKNTLLPWRFSQQLVRLAPVKTWDEPPDNKHCWSYHIPGAVE